MADEVEVSGLSELHEVLQRRLPEALQGKAMQTALAKAAKPIVDEARARAPARTPRGFVGPVQPGKERGTLRRAIYSYRNRNSTKTYESRFIGVRPRAFYWRWIEFGRAAITKAKGSFGSPKKGWFGKQVAAVPAKPFMRPAFEANKYRAIEIVRQALAPAIEKVAAAARRRGIRRITKKLTGI